MASIVDPYMGFVSFKQAVEQGTVQLGRCEGRDDLYFMADHPQGHSARLTYGLIVNGVVKGYAVYLHARSVKGKPNFSLGYAIDVPYRNQGIATALVRDSMQELYKGLQPHFKEPGLYVEAVVGVDNVASQRVAAKVFEVDPEDTTESESGQPALYYLKYIE